MVADLDLPASAIRMHRHCKRRVLLAYLLSQRRENWQIPFTGFRVRVSCETSGLWFDHVEFHCAYADRSTNPILFLPSFQSINRDIGTKAQLADFSPERSSECLETATAVQCHAASLVVVISRRETVANQP